MVTAIENAELLASSKDVIHAYLTFGVVIRIVLVHLTIIAFNSMGIGAFFTVAAAATREVRANSGCWLASLFELVLQEGFDQLVILVTNHAIFLRWSFCSSRHRANRLNDTHFLASLAQNDAFTNFSFFELIVVLEDVRVVLGIIILHMSRTWIERMWVLILAHASELHRHALDLLYHIC